MQGLQIKQEQQRLQQALRCLSMAERSALALAYVHDLLQAPADFTYRVMQGIKPLPAPFPVAGAAGWCASAWWLPVRLA